VANYRPVSLLTAFSKVFEKIIYDRLLQHIETNNILTDEHFALELLFQQIRLLIN
jgi:fructose-1,6-bisphosphatase/inositol monophosphatase family enzyme